MNDSRTMEFRLTFKSVAIKAGSCDAEPVSEYLREHRIVPEEVSQAEHHILRRGRTVLVEDDDGEFSQWKVVTVNTNTDTVTLQPFDEELGMASLEIPIETAINNIV